MEGKEILTPLETTLPDPEGVEPEKPAPSAEPKLVAKGRFSGRKEPLTEPFDEIGRTTPCGGKRVGIMAGKGD
jgi:hypothetical protein